ncbi:MAG: helix-hairpin-helix domain-containing protein [Oscillospiraceae bacterium]|nr:helix-hairpin-helix domain-containing protein [Oscillospiraceae bacterium]
MRKPGISPLLVITILFAVFSAGFFLGRNQNRNTVSVSLPAEFMTVPSVTTEPERAETEEPRVISFPISINDADKESLMALPGIGEVLAQRILDYRDENGAFSAPEALLNVEGIGKKRLEEILDLITIGG